tara:strand:+ start:19 stop:540 length:522 start_codon:yes stop_codon:yes gene_type:complete
MIIRAIFWVLVMAISSQGQAEELKFENIDGGFYYLSEFHGKVLLIANTASNCGFTSQYRSLQELFDRYKSRGLVVLVVPSNDFKQEFSDNKSVKDFCQLNYSLNLPMTTITRVRGAKAHPFYKWIKSEYGFSPNWNFNKIIINKRGKMVKAFGSIARPMGPRITKTIEAQLAE